MTKEEQDAKKAADAAAKAEAKAKADAEKEPVKTVGVPKLIPHLHAPKPVSNAVVPSQSEAEKLFKKSYSMPAGDNFAYVCEDGNVFYQSNENSAIAHATQGKKKLYTVKK